MEPDLYTEVSSYSISNYVFLAIGFLGPFGSSLKLRKFIPGYRSVIAYGTSGNTPVVEHTPAPAAIGVASVVNVPSLSDFGEKSAIAAISEFLGLSTHCKLIFTA